LTGFRKHLYKQLFIRTNMHVDISVVVPMRNEAPNVDQLYRELTSTLEALGRPFEIIAIDDGSTDETFQLLADRQARDHRLRIIRFRRNFGQTAAFSAGFAHARGRVIVTTDGDLQNDPRDIPGMIALWTSDRLTSSRAGARTARTRSSTGGCPR
jgi:glycosyltransferase involved in cell wall biosynthesis